MRKCLLVMMIGMVLALDLYGIVEEIIANVEETEAMNRSVTVVHVE